MGAALCLMFHRIAEADAARSLAMLLCSWYCSAEVGFYSCMLPSSSCFSCLLHICYYFVLVGSVWLRCLCRAQTVWFFCVSCMCARNKHNVWFFSCNMRVEYSLRFYWVAPYLSILVAGALTCILHHPSFTCVVGDIGLVWFTLRYSIIQENLLCIK